MPLIELGLRLEAIGTALLLFSGLVWCWRVKVRIETRRKRWGKI